jgi:hypothetical protein
VPKLFLSLGSSGQLVLYLCTYEKKEYRTFLLKIDRPLLEAVWSSSCLDADYLDYVDISKVVKKGIDFWEPLPLLAYLFDSVNCLPEAVLAYLNLDKNLIQNVQLLTNSFKEFRQQKNIIKAIKFKAEIIKVSEDEGITLDGVCNILALGESEKEAKYILLYKKYKTLELANLEQIVLDQVGFAEVPRWIRICYNLKELSLNKNSLISIRKEELPSSLTTLSLKWNCLTSIDLYNLGNLTHLYLKKNQLTVLNLTENICLKELSIRGNDWLKRIIGIPPSLKVLLVDKETVQQFDFEPMRHLAQLMVFNGEAKREEFVNLAHEVVLKCI